jgi:alpha,alpha-trehalase
VAEPAAIRGLHVLREYAFLYDYRNVWRRDQCITGQAAARVGSADLVDAAVGYVTARLGEQAGV